MVERIWSENSFCLRAYRSIPRITSLRSSLRVLNSPANISFAFFCRSDLVPVMVSAMLFCASSSGVRRAASRATKSLIVASSSQAFPTSSMDGPAHTAATEISGTLIWLHGQSGKRGSAASDVPRKASSTATAMATHQHLMRRPQALRAAREILARDRTRGCDHEQSRAPADDCERNPIDLAVKCNEDHAHTAAANVDQTRRTSCDLICVRGATLPDVQTRIGKTIMGRREGMFDNLHDGPVTCVGAWVSQHFGIQFPE